MPLKIIDLQIYSRSLHHPLLLALLSSSLTLHASHPPIRVVASIFATPSRDNNHLTLPLTIIASPPHQPGLPDLASMASLLVDPTGRSDVAGSSCCPIFFPSPELYQIRYPSPLGGWIRQSSSPAIFPPLFASYTMEEFG